MKMVAVLVVVVGLLVVAGSLARRNASGELELRCADGTEPDAVQVHASFGDRDAALEWDQTGAAALSVWNWKNRAKIDPRDPASLAPDSRRSLSSVERSELLRRLTQPGATARSRAALPDGGGFSFAVFRACYGLPLEEVLRVDHYRRWPDSDEHYREWQDHPLDVGVLRKSFREADEREEKEPFAARSIELISAAFP